MKFLKAYFLICITFLSILEASAQKDSPSDFTIASDVFAKKSWQPLVAGDKVYLLAPSAAPTSEAIAKAKQLIREQGYEPIISSDLLAPSEFGRSNTLEYRTNDFLSALFSDAKVIWALRGGNGASGIFRDPRFKDPILLEKISAMPPKLLIGFSDFTAIHLFGISLDWPCLHGIVLSYCIENITAVNAQTSVHQYLDILKGDIQALTYQLVCENEFADFAKIDSSVVGGNLSLIQRAMGTSRMIKTKGKILFIEDVGEIGRKLDEALSQLIEASLLDDVKAVIWGDFSGDKETIDTAKQLFNIETTKKEIPFFSTDMFGHGPLNMPLPFNTLAKIDCGAITIWTNN